jgi:hypothetical protein
VGDYGRTEATRGWGHPIGVLTRQSGSVRVQTRGLSERVTLCVRACMTNRCACVRVNAKLRICAAPVCVCVCVCAHARVLHVCVCACACVCVCVCDCVCICKCVSPSLRVRASRARARVACCHLRSCGSWCSRGLSRGARLPRFDAHSLAAPCAAILNPKP